VDVGGIDVKVEVGRTVFVRTTLAVGPQEAKIKVTRKTVTMFLIFIDAFLCKELPNETVEKPKFRSPTPVNSSDFHRGRERNGVLERTTAIVHPLFVWSAG